MFLQKPKMILFDYGQLRLKQVLLAMLIFAVLPFGCSSPNRRGDATRPIILHNSVYTPAGSPLRGTLVGTDGNAPGTFVPTPEEMMALSKNGLNALHIYAEKRYDGLPAGAAAENCDYLIDQAEQNGMYVVLTVAGMQHEPENYEQDVQFLFDFWTFYAPRYANRPHVIYEICNEVPLVENIAEVEADLYRLIRKHAPDTMVLFYSLAATDPVETCLPYLERTAALIDENSLWDNAAVAFHGYECQEDQKGADQFRSVIHTLTRLGYPLMNTELPNRFELSNYPDTALLRVCEEEGISWLSFVYYTRIMVPSFWRGQIDAAGITWLPDKGDWPVVDALCPFVSQRAFECAVSSTVEPVSQERHWVYPLEKGDVIQFDRLNFGAREPLSFTVMVQAEQEGILSVRTGEEMGQELGRCEIPPSHGKFIEVTGYLLSAIDGISDIVIVHEGGDGTIVLRDWRFNLPAQSEYSDPYSGPVFAFNYPYRTGSIRRAPNTDAGSNAALQVEGLENGSSLLFDFVGFHGKNVVLHLRAMPLAGGRVDITAGDMDTEIYELGSLDISGDGGWQEYRCTLDQGHLLMFDPFTQHWDLQFSFHGEEKGKELFIISEFWFEKAG